MWYALPFGIRINLPLFLLHGYFFLWSTQISLLIAVYCIFSLIPFTVAIRKLLSISEALNEKHDEVLAATTQAEMGRLTKELSDIAVGALYVNDYNAFETGIEKLVDLASRRPHTQHLARLVSTEILGLLRRNAGNQFASDILLAAIAKIGLNCVPDEKAEITVAMLERLSEAY